MSTAVMSPEPIVKLVRHFERPYNLTVATARTCYSSKTIYDEDVVKTPKARERRDAIAKSIYQAGHHTTFQHATFEFVLEQVSRQFIWSFLHSHTFYNSEQVSQRYVEVKPDNVVVPSMPERAEMRYREVVAKQMEGYHRLIDLVEPVVAQEFYARFPARQREPERWAKAIKKKQQEVARYVLPVATCAHLYHTVSGITLFRYYRLCEQFDVPLEQRLVVEKMVQAVHEVDPEFFKLAEGPIPLEDTLEYQAFSQFHEAIRDEADEAFLREFDDLIGGHTSKLVDHKLHGESTLAQAVRSVLGLPRARLSDEEAVRLVLDPAQNPHLTDTLNLTTMSKLTRTMVHPHFTFRKKLSHTADSQDQRHRMIPGSRPILRRQVSPHQADYIVPAVVHASEEANEYYQELMEDVWEGMRDVLDAGASVEAAGYLLPNAVPIRFEESGDLLNWHHKWTLRLCYNAQEEIWNASLDEVKQVKEVHPVIGEYLLPPCTPRLQAGRKPICPEGDRYCGVPVWRLDLEEYERVI